jgi:drug/metabolite transporter (DMT)-like permease
MVGVVTKLAGVVVFFRPWTGKWCSLGYLFDSCFLAANTAGTLIGRKINAHGRTNPFAVTIVSMGVGAALLLGSGLAWQGLPEISTRSILIIIILAVVNTAFTFVSWNYSLQTLPATESSIINNTMMVYIAILAWIFLGEEQDVRGIIGLVLAFVGAVIVNLNFNKQKQPAR